MLRSVCDIVFFSCSSFPESLQKASIHSSVHLSSIRTCGYGQFDLCQGEPSVRSQVNALRILSAPTVGRSNPVGYACGVILKITGRRLSFHKYPPHQEWKGGRMLIPSYSQVVLLSAEARAVGGTSASG